MIEPILALLAGLLIGSFLNVCIYRMPRDLSVVRPRSFCPSCRQGIAWYDNMPIVSYFVLRGRCRYCEESIPLRYPLVEALTGALFFYFVYSMGFTAVALKFCLFSALIVGLVFSDLEERILPDEFTLGGTGLGFVMAALVPMDMGLGRLLLPSFLGEIGWSVGESMIGAVFCSGFLWGTGALYNKIRHREGLGFGDVKLVAMIGAFLGLHGALMTVILGSILGSVVGFAYIRLAGKDAATYELPYGTFLGVAALIVPLFGKFLIAGAA